jgi:ribose/xylose/arabinose/galactoside ABC-type transport system permease subunit
MSENQTEAAMMPGGSAGGNGSGSARSLLSRVSSALDLRRNGLALFFLAMVGVVALMRPDFVSVENFVSILRGQSFIGIIACGMAIVMIAGGFDLSVARVAALTGVIVGTVHHLGPIPAIAIALGVAALIGLVNGTLITRARVNPFVVTLGMFSIASSLTLVASGGETRRDFEPWLLAISEGNIGPVPSVIVYFLATALVCHLLLSRTRFGQYVYAVGGSVEASRLAGVPTSMVITASYVIVSLCAGIAGVVAASYLRSATPGAFAGGELDAIAAVILGGVRLGGGVGTIPRTVLGVLILGAIGNALIFLGIDPFWQGFVKGSVIIIAVAIDALQNRQRTT